MLGTMGKPIFFSVEYLMGAMFKGISNENIQIKNLSDQRHGADIELTLRSKDGSFKLEVCSEYQEDCSLAMKKALFTMLTKLRRSHGISVGDFHYMMIMEKYNLFTKL